MTACREPGCPWDSCDRPGHNPDHDPAACCRAVVTTGHMGEHEPGCAEGRDE